MAHFVLEERIRKPRKMQQPTKDYIRAELALALAENERLREENARLRYPLWMRLFRWVVGVAADDICDCGNLRGSLGCEASPICKPGAFARSLRKKING